MPIKISCSHCDQHLKCPDSLMGKQVKCPMCDTMNDVPAGEDEEKTESQSDSDLEIEDSSPEATPDRIGNHVLIKKLGVGGMGTVYQAVDENLGRLVALKVLSRKLSNDSTYVKRFEQEARSAANLNHPNIVTIYDIGEENGCPYFAMEFVEGMTARDKLKEEGKLSLDESLGIAIEIAEALDYAWNHGKIIHRDVKPDNILLSEDGHVKLSDLGLAKIVSEDSTITKTGSSLGSPAYMAPEQAIGSKDIDCRADMYSLGITLFHLTTGTLPFNEQNPILVIRDQAETPLPDPKEYNPDLPDDFSALLGHMCAKEPSQRYESHSELLQDLRALSHGESLIVPRPDVLTGEPEDSEEEEEIHTVEQQAPSLPAPSAPTRSIATKHGAKPSKPRNLVGNAVVAVAVIVVAFAAIKIFPMRKPSPVKKSSSTPKNQQTVATQVITAKLKQFELAYRSAEQFALKNPTEYQKIISGFVKVKTNARGTEFVEKAAGKANLWKRKWEDAAENEFHKTKEKSETQASVGRIDLAQKIWEKFPDKLRTDDIRILIDSSIAALRRKATLPENAPAKAIEAGTDAKGPETVTPEDPSTGTEKVQAPVDSSEAQRLALEEGENFEGLLRVFTDIHGAISPLLKEHNYEKAAKSVQFRAVIPRNKTFKVDLMEMKGDIQAVQSLYQEFLKVMEKSIGEEVTMGARTGRVIDVRDGYVILEKKNQKVIVEPARVAPVIIQQRIGIDDQSASEQKFALAVLYLHSGYVRRAEVLFEKLGEDHAGVPRLSRWIRWSIEVAASEQVQTLKDAGAAANIGKISDLADEFSNKFSQTQVARLEQESVSKLKKEAEAKAEAKRKAIEDRLAKLAEYASQAQKTLNDQYQQKKSELESKFQEDKSAREEKVNALKENLKNPEDREVQKKVKREQKILATEVKRIQRKYRDWASKLKDSFSKRRASLRTKEQRLVRKVKAGEKISDEDLQKGFRIKGAKDSKEDGAEK